MNGQLTKTLISREQPAGYYNTEWDASNVSTGLYVYRIDAGSFHDVKKCIFIK
jgi:flagellar hook assembly protein FlgD